MYNRIHFDVERKLRGNSMTSSLYTQYIQFMRLCCDNTQLDKYKSINDFVNEFNWTNYTYIFRNAQLLSHKKQRHNTAYQVIMSVRINKHTIYVLTYLSVVLLEPTDQCNRIEFTLRKQYFRRSSCTESQRSPINSIFSSIVSNNFIFFWQLPNGVFLLIAHLLYATSGILPPVLVMRQM